MKIRVWGRVSTGLFVSALVGCGGGSGGGGYGSGSSMPAPTVSISQPAAGATVNLGQAVTVTWTSAYATSCTASASSAAGGTFTATPGLSGSQTVVPTAAGTYTYTLACTGTGGTMSATGSVTVAANLLATLAPKLATTVGSTGSTSDPTQGYNPYGLTIAPATLGLITKGDLVVCNFNTGGSTAQGTGTTIVGLNPTAGATPYAIAQSSALQGCNALTMLPDDSISAAGWTSNMNPLVSAAGGVGTPFNNTFAGPWGEAFVAATATQPAAIYVSNAPGSATFAAGGTIDRISLGAGTDAESTFTEIVTGFCTSGVPGSIYGPSGLTYDPASDTLYIVDTSSASVVAITGVSAIPADGVVVNGQCSGTAAPTPALTFSGPSMAAARVIAHGAPLSAPLSAALLKNGDLVVANADIGTTTAGTATNQLIEVSPVMPGGFVGNPVQVDTGTPGALFGLAATVDAAGNQVIYFNDDNNNAVMQLGPVTSTTAPPAPGY
jgi:hypothetical protein